MSSQIPGGRFYLSDGIRLIHGAEGGVVLQPTPLRAIRVNTTAMEILEKCRTGFSIPGDSERETLKAELTFVDTLHDAGILYWVPPEEAFEPYISIIVPVYNRAHEIGACLESLLSLDYPALRREIIVVDDASRDDTKAVVRRYDVRLIIQTRNLGQSAARNAGVRASRGKIIAFIDSDCIADSRWLRDLLPYFHDPRLALVGGSVDSFFGESRLDRYEEVHSPLNMGPRRVAGKGKQSVFYVPTCNMLVRKDIYTRAGGLDERLRVGEDVDLCWRLMSMGHRLMYVPKGNVKHKHRNRFLTTFRRRFDYGTSEALLYDRYHDVSKQFPRYWEGILILLLIAAGLTVLSVVPLIPVLAFLLGESVYKKMRIKRRFDIALPLVDIFTACVKCHLLTAYHLGHHLARYYLLPVVIVSILIPQAAPPLIGMVILPTIVEFFQKKPRLSFPVFTLFFWMEQLFYQAGVFWGCLKQGSFRLYRVSFVRATFF
jgi:mycofactocin system glycosyltransferase